MYQPGVNTQSVPNQFYSMQQPYYSFGQAQQTYIPPMQNNTMNARMPQAQTTSSYLSGRVVNSEDEITPQEIPMDGTLSLFPKADGSCVYGKAWNKDGSIRTIRYIPTQEEVVANQEGADISTVLQDIQKRLDRIEKNTSYRRKPYSNKTNYVKQEEADSNDE